MKAAVYDLAGPPDVMRYADVADPVCPADGVLIRVEAVSIEGGDLINRASSAPPHPAYVAGYAAAGEVVALGAEVRDRYVGQKVTSFDQAGSHAELRAVPTIRTWTVPDALDMAAASAVPIAFGTAHHCLFVRGGLLAGETVLIQGGAGGVGLAAVQLAHRAGATVIATVSGTLRARRLLSLGADHVIDYRTTDVLGDVMQVTQGRGVDLVVDPVGSTLQTSLASLRPEGRLVFVGNAGGQNLNISLWPALQANQSLFGVFMGSQFEKPEVRATVSMLLERVAGRTLAAIIDRSFPLADAAAAHAHAEGRAIFGRVVLIP